MYQKPEIVLVGNALEIVKGSDKTPPNSDALAGLGYYLEDIDE